MKLLLDTHIYLWCLNDDRRLRKETKNLIMEATEVYVSSVSIWEAAIKIKLKKLKIEINSLIEGITQSGFSELVTTSYHAAYTLKLPDIHRDPFDRLLIAQAMTEPLKFLTADVLLAQYSELIVQG